MKCPRCSANITAAPDELGLIVCSQCGAKLRARAPAAVKVQGGTGPAKTAAHASGVAAEPAPADIDSVLARLDTPPSPTATLPPGTPLKPIPRPEGQARPAGAPAAATVDAILTEIRAVRRGQDEMLALLKARPAPAAEAPAAQETEEPFLGMGVEDAATSPPAPVRSRRRKSVLLIDDDEGTRQAALDALAAAEVPARSVADGAAAIEAIAADRPDVIVLELGIGGSLPGKDVVNMIKATMEWVDIPVVLYTRVPVQSQKEARTIHGADELVPKRPGAAEALVSQVIALFRKG